MGDSNIFYYIFLQHVLTNMNISEEYRTCAFEAMKSLMIPKPDPPSLRGKQNRHTLVL